MNGTYGGAPGSLLEMSKSQAAYGQSLTGLPPGLVSTKPHPAMSFGSGAPMDVSGGGMFAPPGGWGGGGGGTTTNNYNFGGGDGSDGGGDGGGGDDNEDQTPAKPMVKHMMGSAGGGGLAGFDRNQVRGPGAVGFGTGAAFGGAFANGGIAPAGKASLVGENGPEVIIPTGPTKVIPNHELPFGQRSPNLTLPNGGNDATMMGVRSFGGPPPASKGPTNMMFGVGAPQTTTQFVNGFGQQPGQNSTAARTYYRSWPPGPDGMSSTPPPPPMPPPRSPMAAVPSAQNHSYDGGVGFGSGLAGRGTRQVGRSMYDLNRIAQQRFRQTGDPSLLFAMDWRNRTYPQTSQAAETPFPFGQGATQPQPQGAAPEAPGAELPPQNPAPSGPGMQPVQPVDPQTISLAPMLPWDGKGPLPPSVLGGGSGVPPPPLVDAVAIPHTNGMMVTQAGKPTGQTFTRTDGTPEPFVPTPEQVKSHNLQPDFSNTTIWNGKHYPAWKTAKPTPETVVGVDANGVVKKFPAGYELPEGWTALKKVDATAPAPAASTPSSPQGIQGQTPNGVKFQIAPQADVGLGQMPNVAYANDLPPVASLEEARAHYAKTGDDSQIRQFLRENPSEQVKLLKQQQDVLDEAARLAKGAYYKQGKIAAAGDAKDAYLAGKGLTRGSDALLWEARHPQEAALLRETNGIAESSKKLDEANALNDQLAVLREQEKIKAREASFQEAVDHLKKTGSKSLLELHRQQYPYQS